MAGDFNKPVLGDQYSDVLLKVRELNAEIAKGLDPAVVSTANIPSGAIRWRAAVGYWEKFNGSTWSSLAETYAINAATASKWATARTITLTGNVTGTSGSFDGSGNLSFTASLALHSAAAKTALEDTDDLALADNGAAWAMKRIQVSNFKTWLASVVPSPIPSGTKMLFQQTAAPTGWTKDTTHDNKALRVVSGTASTGGSVAFTTAFASQAVSGTVASHTLTTAEMPSHSHRGRTWAGQPAGGAATMMSRSDSAFGGTAGDLVEVTGGGAGHTHGFSGTAINMAVQYVDLIIATKD